MLSHNTNDREPQLAEVMSPKIKLADHPSIAICVPVGDKEDMTRYTCPAEHGGCGKEWLQAGRRHPMLVPMHWHLKGKNLSNPLSTVTVQLVESGRPSGEARQVMTNKALDMGVKYILYWDDDVIPEFNALANLHTFLEVNPKVGAVSAVVPTRANPCEPFVYRAHGEGAWWDFPMGPGAVPQPIHGCGAGFLLARAEAVREVQEKLGDEPIWADLYIPVGESEDEVVWGPNSMEHMWGHDMRFVRLLNTNGWPVYVDGKELCQHVDVENNKIYKMPEDAPGFTGPRDIKYGYPLDEALPAAPTHSAKDYPSVDIIVVNAPKEYSNQVLENRTIEAVARHTNYPNYNLVVRRNEPGKALSVFWNDLIEASEAEYVCLLNNDTVVTPGWLTSMVDIADTDTKVGAVVPSSNMVFMSQIDTTLDRHESDFDVINQFATTLPIGTTEELDLVSAMCVLFPRKVWEDAGKFDEDFFLYGEDTEFFWRVRNKLGLDLIWDQSAYVHHYKAQSTGQMDPDELARIRKESEILVNQKTDLTISHGGPPPKFMPGSNLIEGWTYHPNPYDSKAPSHRRGDTRLQLLKTYGSFEGKDILDLGCNLGYFGFNLSDYGSYTGIDYDEKTIKKAHQIAVEHNTDEIMEFRRASISLPMLKEFNPDVVFAFSVLPWLREAGEDLDGIMKYLAGVPEVYIELMYEGDGMSGGMDIRDDESAIEYLKSYFAYVTRLGNDPDWRNRTLWKCTNSFGDNTNWLESPYSGCRIVFTDNDYVKKIYPEGREKFAGRERDFLDMLEPYDIAPKTVHQDKDMLVMTRLCGHEPSISEIEQLHQPIVDALEACNIIHRDIRPENLIVSQGKMYLLDFEWAIHAGETLEHPDSLGSKYRVPGFDNKETFENIINMERV